ncbi:MAG: LacI family transcriptional regulator [Akkermansiaceae bacterium]|nr:LacI family transcriptional regulator [Akkermansiaceae bacterium]
MNERITMAEVAKAAGVTSSTVSKALRNDPRISAEKRREIQAVAEALGYRPNPLVSALMMNRKSISTEGGITTIALVTDYGGDEKWQTKDVCTWEYEGIVKRANELGFRVEEFAIADYRGDVRQLERTLKTRGIRGILLGFSRERSRKTLISTDDFVVAGLSAYFREAMVDRSNFHGLYNVRLALTEIRKLGYKRTGLVVPEVNNRISGYQWSASALDWQRHLTREDRCAPFVPDGDDSQAAFVKWMHDEKPDSLLVYKLPVKTWLSQLGLRIPQDIGVAYLYRKSEEMKTAAGLDGKLQSVGAAAIDLVVEGLTTNRFGLPKHPKEVLIKGEWNAGETLLGR